MGDNFDKTVKDLIENMKEFRRIAEERIMDTDSWNEGYLLCLKELHDEVFNLQVKLRKI